MKQYCSALRAEASDEHSNELAEACLITMEAMFKSMPREMDEFTAPFFKQCVHLVAYDPGYDYADNEEEAEEEEEGWGSDYEDDEDQQVGADEENSWKVRRSAVRVIHAIIKTRADF